VTEPQPVKITPPMEPSISAKPAGPLSTDERAARIVNYLRYFDGGDCLYISPLKVSEKAAQLATFSDFRQSVTAFETDFKTVNGFAPAINDVRISRAQCEMVPFLFRIDPTPDVNFSSSLRAAVVKHGEHIQARFDGLGSRKLQLLMINEDGTLRNLSPLVRLEGGAASLDVAIDDADASPQAQKLLLALATPQPLNALVGTASPANNGMLDNIAAEIEQTGSKVAVSMQLVTFK